MEQGKMPFKQIVSMQPFTKDKQQISFVQWRKEKKAGTSICNEFTVNKHTSKKNNTAILAKGIYLYYIFYGITMLMLPLLFNVVIMEEHKDKSK